MISEDIFSHNWAVSRYWPFDQIGAFYVVSHQRTSKLQIKAGFRFCLQSSQINWILSLKVMPVGLAGGRQGTQKGRIMSQDNWIQKTGRRKGVKWLKRGLDHYWKLTSSGKITSISASQEDSISLQYACEWSESNMPVSGQKASLLHLRTAIMTTRSMVLLEGLLEVLPWVMETKQLLKGKMTQHQ